MTAGSLPALYLDDCSDADQLVALAANAGFQVHTPRSENTQGWDDDKHLEFAAQRGFAVLTYNVKDFKLLHEEWQAAGRRHSGILVVYLENNRVKDMSRSQMVGAILKLVAAGLPLENEFHVLNHWR
jgi:hypothetical protein